MKARCFDLLIGPLVLATCAVVPAEPFGFTPAASFNTYAFPDAAEDAYPSIASDGNSTWIVAWKSTFPFPSCNRCVYDPDIWVTRTTNNGYDWVVQAPLYDDGAYYSAQNAVDGYSGVELQFDGVGTWIASWTRDRDRDSPSDSNIATARSFDSGISWSPVEFIQPDVADIYSTEDAFPSLAADGLGRWIVAWQTTNPLWGVYDTDVVASGSSDSGLTWTAPPVAINDDAIFDGAAHDLTVDIDTDGTGWWLAAWCRGTATGGVRVSHSTNNGATWAPARQILSGGGLSSDLVTDKRGRWVLIAATLDGPSQELRAIQALYSNDRGLTWSSPRFLEVSEPTGTHSLSNPKLATDGRGTWFAVWESRWNSGFPYTVVEGLHLSQSTDNGATWSPPEVLADGDHLNPSIAMNRRGDCMVVWDSSNPYDFPAEDRDIFYSALIQPNVAAPSAWADYE